MFKTFKTILAFAVSFSIVSISNSFADGHAGAIKKWSNGEFSLSVLSAKEREKELNWFHDAAKPFKGMSLKVVSEGRRQLRPAHHCHRKSARHSVH